MKKLEIEQMVQIEGGVTQEEYCATLGALLTGGGYQGDYTYGMSVYYNNCGKYGIPLPLPN